MFSYRRPDISCAHQKWRHTALTHGPRSLAVLSHLLQSGSFLCVKVNTAVEQGQMMWYQAMISSLTGLQDTNAQNWWGQPQPACLILLFSPVFIDGVYKEICSDLSLSKMSESKWWYMHILGRGAVEMKSEVYAFWSLTFVKTSSQLFILKVWSHTNMWVTQSCKSSCKSSLWVTGIDL